MALETGAWAEGAYAELPAFRGAEERHPSSVPSRAPGKQGASWRDYIPRLSVLEWGRHYRRADLGGDVAAGLVVAVMLIPQGMAYALLAGMPPIYGLWSSIAALLLYPLFATSPSLAVGPVAMVSLLTSAAVSELAEPGSNEYIRLALLLAFLTGVIQVLLGIARMGVVVNFLSHSVLKGFTAAAALIIGSSQLGKLLGYKVPRSKYVYMVWYEAAAGIGDIHWATVALAAENIALLVAFKWLQRVAVQRWPARATAIKSVPTALLVVVLNILLVVALDLDVDEGVSVVGKMPSGLPEPVNVFEGHALGASSTVGLLLPSAVVISLVGYMESISVAKAMALRDAQATAREAKAAAQTAAHAAEEKEAGAKAKGGEAGAVDASAVAVDVHSAPIVSHKNEHALVLDPNQELVGLGVANLLGAFVRTFPVTGGFSRTSVNADAGARTPLSSWISAALLLLVVLFLTVLFERLPDATLGAMIVFAVAKLFELDTPRELYATARGDFWVWVTAFVATLALGIEEGILIACGISIAIVVRQAAQPHWARVGALVGADGSVVFRNVARFPAAREVPGAVLLRFDAALFFANAGFFKGLVLDHVNAANAAASGDAGAGSERVRRVVVDCGAVVSVDATALHMLHGLAEELHNEHGGATLMLVNVRGPVRDTFAREHAYSAGKAAGKGAARKASSDGGDESGDADGSDAGAAKADAKDEGGTISPRYFHMSMAEVVGLRVSPGETA